MHRCSDTSKFNSVRKTQMHQQGGNLKIKSRFGLVKIIPLEKLVWSQWPRMRHGKQKWRWMHLRTAVWRTTRSFTNFLWWPQCASLPVCGINSKGLSLWLDLHPIAVHILPIIIISLLTFARHLTTSKTRDYNKLNPCHALQKAVIDHPCYPLT